MVYLAHTVHAQLVGFWLGSMGWILTMVTIGLVQWRVWCVADLSDVLPDVAWIGIWRVCFYSHTLVPVGHGVLFCQKMSISDSFVPMEIAVAQVLMLVALVLGLSANASTIYGLRFIFFGLDERRPVRVSFVVGGIMHLLSGLCSLLPLALNLHAIATNQIISFPESFHLPPAPLQQHAGAAIGVGMTAVVLSVFSGVLFLCYRFPSRASAKVQPATWTEVDRSEDGLAGRTLSSRSAPELGRGAGDNIGQPLTSRSAPTNRTSKLSICGLDNAGFQSDEHV